MCALLLTMSVYNLSFLIRKLVVGLLSWVFAKEMSAPNLTMFFMLTYVNYVLYMFAGRDSILSVIDVICLFAEIQCILFFYFLQIYNLHYKLSNKQICYKDFVG
jgi:hypothetical protein